MLEKEVMEPRRAERAEMERARTHERAGTGLRYDYASELFSARRKDFWPLFHARTVLQKLIPTKLCHESDGLIFQVLVVLLTEVGAVVGARCISWCPHVTHNSAGCGRTQQ